MGSLATRLIGLYRFRKGRCLTGIRRHMSSLASTERLNDSLEWSCLDGGIQPSTRCSLTVVGWFPLSADSELTDMLQKRRVVLTKEKPYRNGAGGVAGIGSGGAHQVRGHKGRSSDAGGILRGVRGRALAVARGHGDADGD